MVENFRDFHGLASNREGFPANFFFFIIRCFELLYNHESFPMNNKRSCNRETFPLQTICIIWYYSPYEMYEEVFGGHISLVSSWIEAPFT